MAERETIRRDGEIVTIGVAASTKIEAGKIVCNNGSGYAVEGADTASLVALGVAEETVDNSSGSDGDLNVKVRRKKAFWFKNASSNSVTIADIGTSNACISDDETVILAAGVTNNIALGKVLEVDATNGVLVEIE